MSVSADRLATWSQQGAIQTAASTHTAIRNALSAYQGWPAEVTYDVYLQGSYRNATNIRGNSDVDVVVECNSIYYADTALLSGPDRAYHAEQWVDASYGWTEFRRIVLRALRTHFGEQFVREGKHSLKLDRTASHLPADVVPCVRLARYRSFNRLSRAQDAGMTFWAAGEQRQVINYPKLHYQNGVWKNEDARTQGQYKPVVRMFKNAKSYLVDHGKLGDGVAPSYYVECLLYNVPDQQFRGSRQEAFRNVLAWLAESDLDNMACQNGQVCLCGNTAQQWEQVRARQTVDALVRLWNEDSL